MALLKSRAYFYGKESEVDKIAFADYYDLRLCAAGRWDADFFEVVGQTQKIEEQRQGRTGLDHRQ